MVLFWWKNVFFVLLIEKEVDIEGFIFILDSLWLINILIPFIGLRHSLLLLCMSWCDLRHFIDPHILIKKLNLTNLIHVLLQLQLFALLLFLIILIISHFTVMILPLCIGFSRILFIWIEINTRDVWSGFCYLLCCIENAHWWTSYDWVTLFVESNHHLRGLQLLVLILLWKKSDMILCSQLTIVLAWIHLILPSTWNLIQNIINWELQGRGLLIDGWWAAICYVMIRV